MCAHMMSGQVYSAFPGMLMILLGMLLSLALLAAFILPMVHRLSRKTTLGMRREPQPHDEPSIYAVPPESALQVLRERYIRGEIEP